MSAPTMGEADAAVPTVARGVYRFGSSRVNWYAVEADGQFTVVDAGLPGHWDQLTEGLAALGASLSDVGALVLTHGHSDHIGIAERLRTTASVPVYVHEADAAMTRGEAEVPAGLGMLKDLWRPALLGLLVEMARSGGFSIDDVEQVSTFVDGETLDVPGDPRVIHVPGHSAGSCALWLPDRAVLFCGDALATLDIKTGRRAGPQLMSLFNADREQARGSLDRLADLGEVTMLPGHGEPWEGAMADAIATARPR